MEGLLLCCGWDKGCALNDSKKEMGNANSIFVSLFHKSQSFYSENNTIFQYIQSLSLSSLSSYYTLSTSSKQIPPYRTTKPVIQCIRDNSTQSTQPRHRPETTQTTDKQWSNTQSFEGNETHWARVLNVRLGVFPKGSINQSRPRLGGHICPLICRKQTVGRHIITRHHCLVCCVGGRGHKSFLPGTSMMTIMICTET